MAHKKGVHDSQPSQNRLFTRATHNITRSLLRQRVRPSVCHSRYCV